MPVETETVQRPVHDSAIPDLLSVPAQLFAEMSRQGVLERLGAALRLSRRGGYTGRPLVAFGLAYLAANTRLGLRPFWERFKRPLKRVAAVAGCSRLPSSSSVSRALVRVAPDTADAFADAALSIDTLPELQQLLAHPAVVHRDSQGQTLHVLDIDPSVQAYRLRDLIESDDHPEPERQVPGVPGYTGHYRGEVRIRHVAVCHAGAGLWLAYRMSDHHPRLSTFFPSVLRPALRVMSDAGIPATEILVRGDAEFGSAGVARAIQALGVQLLVRISRYHLLDRPEVLDTLQRAVWEDLSSKSGRKRQAAELGQVMLHPSAKSADAGTSGIALRVVVVRRPVKGPEVPYGTFREGGQYELFATTLSAEAWSAADIVTLYAGRSTIENRFAQQDRELDLERTFSFHAPGQGVFTVLGLFLWNFWTCTGFLAAPPPDLVPMPLLRRAPPEPSAARLCEIPSVASPPIAVPRHEPPRTPDPLDPYPYALAEERTPLVALLATAYQDVLQIPGWSLDPSGFLRCPHDQRLFPFSLARVGPGRSKPQVIVRTDVGACDGCPLRAGCFSSTRPNMYKQISRAMSADQGATLASFLARHPPGRRLQAPAAPRPTEGTTSETVPLPMNPIVRPASTAPRGKWVCTTPTFFAAAARQRARSQYEKVRVEIHIGRKQRQAAEPPDAGRIRQTWAQRDRRCRLDACVRLIRHIPHQPPKKCDVSKVRGSG